ncbi:hopanoid biosynthesis-associated protein HpnK [Bombella saccharophila]|uniref:Hopanoid biosynthesis-associated protein HpnK n=1 Tax=Bombella saccharophila TaxID=2967338 RepID=A0ABT3WB99_9PROT|nr:hopanoid biosynthesis-associated protein HpnK [Bombella saccharophila]MCX5614893.1 hopanoid biosynthesis-associated protein HpnK [Bombella saccharophila]
MNTSTQRRVIFSADDFGMSVEVNEAIEEAHRKGLLSTASLMVAAPAFEDALRRAQRMPDLRLGLHLVVIEGDSCLHLPIITDEKGWFGRNQVGLGFQYFFSPATRSALKKEIHAQFQQFARTGLRLDHANAHKHMHLHPTIGHLLLQTGKIYGLKAVRTPMEPAGPLGETPHLGDRALEQWTRVLRWQIWKAGMKTNDSCFGLRWSGHMTPERIQRLIPQLPAGVSEVYFHPAKSQNAQMAALMPGYQPEQELAALTDPATRALLAPHNIQLTTWDAL